MKIKNISPLLERVNGIVEKEMIEKEREVEDAAC